MQAGCGSVQYLISMLVVIIDNFRVIERYHMPGSCEVGSVSTRCLLYLFDTVPEGGLALNELSLCIGEC